MITVDNQSVFKDNVNVQGGFEMSKLWIGFLCVIVLSGLIDAKANAALINESSYLFIGDSGYALAARLRCGDVEKETLLSQLSVQYIFGKSAG